MTSGEHDTGEPPSDLAPRNTSGTLSRVPNQPSTPGRSVRIPDELWQAAQAIADEDEVSRSDVIRVALERYVRARRRQRKGDPKP